MLGLQKIMTEKTTRYQRLAARARANPNLARGGVVLATMIMILGVMDVLSTEMALAVGGHEANGLVRSVQDRLGDLWYVPKIALHALVAAMIVWSPNRPTLCIMGVVALGMAGVVANNLYFAYTLA